MSISRVDFFSTFEASNFATLHFLLDLFCPPFCDLLVSASFLGTFELYFNLVNVFTVGLLATFILKLCIY